MSPFREAMQTVSYHASDYMVTFSALSGPSMETDPMGQGHLKEKMTC